MTTTVTGRLATTFAALRERGERALIPYFTAGDPSVSLTKRLVIEAARRGADIVELGVPFSDPLADGPVIQRATQRALQAGECGVDGVIVADLPPEEARPLRSEAEAAGLDLIHLVAPTSPPDRMRAIARAATGFLYMVSLTGVTGARAELPPDLLQHLRTLRGITTKPICVGFGIGTPEQAAAVGRAADGVIVGSAIVQLVERHGGSEELVGRVGDFVASLKEPLKASTV